MSNLLCSSTAIDELEGTCEKSPYQAFAYYYFSFTDQDDQSTTSMLSSMTRQLCGARPDTPEWLKALGSKFRDKGSRPGLKHLEDALWGAASGFDAVYFIVDALDECTTSQNKRATLLKSLAKLQGCSPPTVHILLTSRKEPDIEAAFAMILQKPAAEEIDLLAFRDAVNHDISIYLQQKFKSAEFNGLSDDNKNFAQKILLEKADGMYVMFLSMLSFNLASPEQGLQDHLTLTKLRTGFNTLLFNLAKLKRVTRRI
jgi:hypothetical protein